MGILEKIQAQPKELRKIILWLIVIIISLGLGTFWIKNFQRKLKSFRAEELKEQLQLPSLESFPKVEIPELKTEELNQLK